MIDPSNLWLTIHESIGHATEYDRAIGYEAAYAGTSFATPDKLGTMRYGSPVMNVTADRTVEYGLASVGFDDEGVRAQSWDLVRDGVFVGYQLDRVFAPRLGVARSNGCSYADSPHHVPIQRMANVSLQPAAEDVSTEDLIARVDDGIYIVGDKIVVDRHAALQLSVHRPAVLPDPRRQARRPGARRRLPGDHHRLLGGDGGRRRTVDLAARRRVQLRQGAARAGRRGQPRLPVGAVPRHQRAEHAAKRAER